LNITNLFCGLELTTNLTTSEYINHHLTNLKIGEGFWTLHLDTLIVSWVLGVSFLFAFWWSARRATSGVPGGFQNVVEMLLEFADRQVKETRLEEHTSELQSHHDLVCRLLLEKKNKKK